MQLATHIDQMGRTVKCSSKPLRIVSLVPSQTQLLHDLGLQDEVIGITKFCIEPQEWFKTKTRIGGTKQVNRELIEAFHPDLIIGNKEENAFDDIEWLAQRFPVWMSDIYTLTDAYQMIEQVGVITNKGKEALNLIAQIRSKFDNYTPASSFSVAYLIWNEPCMTIGRETFIHDMLRVWGAKNVFEHNIDSRYPITNANELMELNPDILLLSSEPFPFNESHLIEWQSKLGGKPVMIVSGEQFSWYGSALKDVPDYFEELNLKLSILKTLEKE